MKTTHIETATAAKKFLRDATFEVKREFRGGWSALSAQEQYTHICAQLVSRAVTTDAATLQAACCLLNDAVYLLR